MMETRALGTSDLRVPAVGMGTWSTFDVRGDAEVAVRSAVVDAALAAGTTLFDTSPMYARSPGVLATVLEGRRDRVLIADKVWTPSASAGREQMRTALARFGCVDIYQIHNLVAWEEQLPQLEALRADGTAKVIGATHYAHSAFPELMRAMRTGRIQMIQIPYSVADRVVQDDVLPLAQDLGLGVLVMQPLGTGKLTRKPPAAEDLARLDAFGVTTWAQALLKWILSDTRVHCVIPATSKPERATENAHAGNPPWFDAETREYVQRIALSV